ncbi:MAG TPA: WecB/TagA/CpsF family glycosyltransferase [Firmicutes bacterium]|nr:WecB/TagA/CpsF family glycosyltransferase [Bacillota bacterium]
MGRERTFERDAALVLGVAVHRVDQAGAGDFVARLVERRREALRRDGGEAGCSAIQTAHIVTANSELVMKAAADREVGEILAAADLVVADGIGVVWAAGFLGTPLPGRVAGIDLAFALIRLAAARGWRVFLLGGEPGVAAEAAAFLCRRFPDLLVSGTHHGYFSPVEEEQVLRQIADSRSDLLLVAMGAPRQERWIAAHRRQLGAAVAIGVGGSFDIWAGRKRRAPLWLQRCGLEWAYRLAREPARIWRMSALPRFVLAVLRQKWQIGGGGRGKDK